MRRLILAAAALVLGARTERRRSMQADPVACVGRGWCVAFIAALALSASPPAVASDPAGDAPPERTDADRAREGCPRVPTLALALRLSRMEGASWPDIYGELVRVSRGDPPHVRAMMALMFRAAETARTSDEAARNAEAWCNTFFLEGREVGVEARHGLRLSDMDDPNTLPIVTPVPAPPSARVSPPTPIRPGR